MLDMTKKKCTGSWRACSATAPTSSTRTTLRSRLSQCILSLRRTRTRSHALPSEMRICLLLRRAITPHPWNRTLSVALVLPRRDRRLVALAEWSFSHDHTSLLWDLERRILKRSSLRRSGMTSSDQASRSEVSDALSMPSLRVCAPTPPGFSQCGLCGASAQDHDLRSCVRLISAGSGASLSALSSPASASLRSVVAAVGFAACTGSCAARTGHS